MAAAFDPVAAMLHAWGTNNRINLYLLENVPEEVWRMKPAGGKGRTVAAIFGHIHNVRLMWLKAIDKNAPLPEKLEGDAFTRDQVATLLRTSAEALEAVLAASLRSDGKIKGFKPDAASFLGYLIAHDAHHRGQVTQLARQLGHAVSQSVNFGMWEWGTR